MTDVDIGQAIIEMSMALACPRFDTRYLPFEQADAAAQPRAELLEKIGQLETINEWLSSPGLQPPKH